VTVCFAFGSVTLTGAHFAQRFHLQINEYKKSNDVIPDYLQNSREGLRSFCKQSAKLYTELEDKSELWHQDGMDHLKTGIPCYAEFFKWVQWHNLANQLTKSMDIPTYYLNYESFESRFDETLDEILQFMSQGREGKPYKFIKGKAYKEYFHPNELKSVRRAMKQLATNETWAHIRHYFD
jgi:hypothetical protein